MWMIGFVPLFGTPRWPAMNKPNPDLVRRAFVRIQKCGKHDSHSARRSMFVASRTAYQYGNAQCVLGTAPTNNCSPQILNYKATAIRCV